MLEKINPIWLHRILRFGLGGIFLGIAFFYKDAWPLYIFGGLIFITGFFRPRRCIDDQCNI